VLGTAALAGVVVVLVISSNLNQRVDEIESMATRPPAPDYTVLAKRSSVDAGGSLQVADYCVDYIAFGDVRTTCEVTTSAQESEDREPVWMCFDETTIGDRLPTCWGTQ
jgi:hypothetical protein